MRKVFLLCLLFIGCENNLDIDFKEGMTMQEVEQLFGKPDKVENKKGGFDKHGESPPRIIWYYKKFKITKSGQNYGKPGYLNFIPERFTTFINEIRERDNIAWKHGVEQSNSFRTVSFKGSFPFKKENWSSGGPFGFVPIKTISKKPRGE